MKRLTLGSHFDGIAGFPWAASIAGIKALWATEIEPFPIQVSKEHFPEMKHYGSITGASGAELEPVNIIAGGFPCQDLSVAGKRSGLKGERSGLFFEIVRTIREMREVTNGIYPGIVVLENVPGLLSSAKGQDFKIVLEELTETEVPMPESGKWATSGVVRTADRELAWTILDAQYFGVPQRRRRVFIVCDFTKRRAAEILFESTCLPGHITESRKTREEVAAGAGNGVETASVYDWGKGDRIGGWVEREDRIFAYQSDRKRSTAQELIFHKPQGCADSLTQQKQYVIAFNGRQDPASSNVTGALRQLLPIECERLQGFPDKWTDIPGASDTARYKAIGNSVAIPCVTWIMQRIAQALQG